MSDADSFVAFVGMSLAAVVASVLFFGALPRMDSADARLSALEQRVGHCDCKGSEMGEAP